MPPLELDIAIWFVPHRPWGHIIHVGSDMAEGDLPGGFFQSFGDIVEKGWSPPQFDPNRPHRQFVVPSHALVAIAQELDRTTYTLNEHAFTPMGFGMPGFGLWAHRGFQEFSVRWSGPFEDQDAQIRKVYRLVEQLAGVDASLPRTR